jgi:hypothetical protein
MTKTDDRFVPVKQLTAILKKTKCDSLIGLMFCKVCGDTRPKHGFYPLFSSAYGSGIINLSSITCTRCAYTDENYEKAFGEPKEQFEFEKNKKNGRNKKT